MYPAKEPLTHAMVAGENAGALPVLAPAQSDLGGGGEGLLRIERKGTKGHDRAYRSYVGGGGFSGLMRCRVLGTGGTRV
jgi:hypothetical protein